LSLFDQHDASLIFALSGRDDLRRAGAMAPSQLNGFDGTGMPEMPEHARF